MSTETECPNCTCLMEGVKCDVCGYKITQQFTPAQQLQAFDELIVRLQCFMDISKKYHLGYFVHYRDADGWYWDKQKWSLVFKCGWGDPDDYYPVPKEILTIPLDELEQWAIVEIQRRKAEAQQKEVQQRERERAKAEQRARDEYDIYLRIKAIEDAKAKEGGA